MEGINNPESFEDFKNRVREVFERDGLTESLSAEIKDWCERRFMETSPQEVRDEEKIESRMQKAEICGIVEKYDLSWVFLDTAWDIAYYANLLGLKDKVEDLMDKIHSKKDGEELP